MAINVYDPEDFKGRVNLAALYIRERRNTSRTFDTCFEMNDGDAVAVALVRRARANPDGQLAKNLWRYIGRELAEATAEEHKDVPTKELPALARRLREASRKANAEFMESLGAEARP